MDHGMRSDGAGLVADGRRQTLDAWSERVGTDLMPFRFEAWDNSEFWGDFQMAGLLGASIFSMVAGDHRAERTTEHVRQDDDEFVIVTFQVDGMLKLAQHGEQVQLTPGHMGMYLSSKPAQLECYGNYESRSIRIPVDRLSIRRRRWEGLGALAFDGGQGLAPLVLSCLTGLFPVASTLTPSARAAASHHLVGLVEAMLAELSPAETPSHPPSAELLEQCLAFIEDHLPDAQLNPQMVADSVHISVRHLHQTFRQAGMTCASHIRARRIDRVRADLTLEEFSTVPVEKIFQRWGVQNPSHFGQVFKQIEGCSPAEFRRRILQLH